MRTNHCSKTYQLGASEVANSACFRRFLGKITGIDADRGQIAPRADAPLLAPIELDPPPPSLTHFSPSGQRGGATSWEAGTGLLAGCFEV